MLCNFTAGPILDSRGTQYLLYSFDVKRTRPQRCILFLRTKMDLDGWEDMYTAPEDHRALDDAESCPASTR